VSAGTVRIDVDPRTGSVRLGGRVVRAGAIEWDVPVRGSVIGVLLNTRSALAELGDAVHAPPYMAPPVAPVLYIKPANTWTACNAPVLVPADVETMAVAASLGIVIGATASRVPAGDASEIIAGYTIVNDFHEPHDDIVVPAIRQRCRDASCAIGPWTIARDDVALPDALDVRVFVNGKLGASYSTAECSRSVARLVADVTGFMTLSAGDVLLLGCGAPSPKARVGDRVRTEIDGVGSLENLLVAGAGRSAGAWHGEVHPRRRRAGPGAARQATRTSGSPTARRRPARGVWLPPLAPTERPRTIFAVESNYADHARISSSRHRNGGDFPEGVNSLVGHRGMTPRPADATYMHYGCALAVVIGRSARRVTRADAYEYIEGYTVANDYTIRDYLENYYRPNFRVKSRDACTPIGPWLVDAADVRNPMNLRLTTTVNGTVTHRGSTGDMVFDIAFLIAYLSAFMTLSPGDIILTGTPDGVSGVHAGDEVITEVGGIGRLMSTVVEDVAGDGAAASGTASG
jgi:5-oxopent-3-ene-1,2,5-tricarboxylate decarboxylase/2-hydroxyhepta-2,4-diene-1,7-dioate isomerase